MNLIINGYGKEEQWWDKETENNPDINKTHPCFDTDKPSKDNTTRAEGIALQARYRRLHGRYLGAKHDQYYKHLDGYCVENTLAVLAVAEERGLRAERVAVMSERDYTDEFESAEDAYEAGFTHHLAQIIFNNPHQEIIIDPSLWQYGPYTGTPYVNERVPPDYVWFRDSVGFASTLSTHKDYHMESIAPQTTLDQ